MNSGPVLVWMYCGLVLSGVILSMGPCERRVSCGLPIGVVWRVGVMIECFIAR